MSTFARVVPCSAICPIDTDSCYLFTGPDSAQPRATVCSAHCGTPALGNLACRSLSLRL